MTHKTGTAFIGAGEERMSSQGISSASGERQERTEFLRPRTGEQAERPPTLLVLGGGFQQLPVLIRAKEMGVRTVLVDYTADCPGREYADRHIKASTTDLPAVLRAAREGLTAEPGDKGNPERIHCGADGIVAFASDPAALTAARAAAELGLPGNPPEAAEILGNKKRFRDFLRENGFAVPAYHVLSENEEGLGCDLSYPILVKAEDSAGSRGVRLVWKQIDRLEAYRDAVTFSRVGRAIEEEYIRLGYRHIVGGDILVRHGHIILNGLMDCYREPSHALVPCGKTWPMALDLSVQHAVLAVLQRIITLLNIDTAEMNAELILGSDGRIYPVDVGLRAGGNGIPLLLSDIVGVDLVKWNILAALGGDTSFRPAGAEANGMEGRNRKVVQRSGPGFFMTYNLHAEERGYFAGWEADPAVRQRIYRVQMRLKPGDPTAPYVNASHVIGILWLHFPDRASLEPHYPVMRNLLRVRYYRIQKTGDRGRILAALWKLGRFLPHRQKNSDGGGSRYGTGMQTSLHLEKGWKKEEEFRSPEGEFQNPGEEERREEQIVLQGETYLAVTGKGDAVGILCIYCNDPMNQTAYITVLSVSPEYRRCRIAEHLLEEAEKDAAVRGFRRIEGEILRGNGSCLALAAKMGYRPARETGHGTVLVCRSPGMKEPDPGSEVEDESK